VLDGRRRPSAVPRCGGGGVVEEDTSYRAAAVATAARSAGPRIDGGGGAHPRWHRPRATQVDDTEDHTRDRARAFAISNDVRSRVRATTVVPYSVFGPHTRPAGRRPDNGWRITYSHTHTYNDWQLLCRGYL